jgi:hypothetical protein
MLAAETVVGIADEPKVARCSAEAPIDGRRPAVDVVDLTGSARRHNEVVRLIDRHRVQVKIVRGRTNRIRKRDFLSAIPPKDNVGSPLLLDDAIQDIDGGTGTSSGRAGSVREEDTPVAREHQEIVGVRGAAKAPGGELPRAPLPSENYGGCIRRILLPRIAV